jgi:aspartyl protease family protein
MRRFYVLIGLVALVALLHNAFPYVLEDENARMRVLYLVVLLCFLAAGGSRLRGRPLPKLARDAAIWLAIIVALVFAYSFRDELGHSRIMAELVPAQVQVEGDGTLSIKASEGGHFFVEGKVNDVAVRFLIDTGASDIVLAPDDARRAGLDTDALDYTHYATTANGTGAGARVMLNSLTIGSIALHHMPASVNKVWMQESLLGMSFLHRLKGFRVEGDRLILMP